jgi:hypothetical protein
MAERRKGGRKRTAPNIYWRNGIAWARKTYRGKEYRGSLETTSATVAQERYTKWLADLKAGGWGERPRRTFVETRDEFIAKYLPRLKPRSADRYIDSLVQLTKHLEGKFLDEIGSAELSRF